MRYGRRRRGFPWRRVIVLVLAFSGAVSLLLVAVNWRSVLGLYRINLVGAAVRGLEGVVEFDPEGLRTRRVSAEAARSRLEQGLAGLGIPARLTLHR